MAQKSLNKIFSQVKETESISDAAHTLDQYDSGKTIFLTLAGATTIHLPAHADIPVGWNVTIIAGTAQAHVISCATNATDTLYGSILNVNSSPTEATGLGLALDAAKTITLTAGGAVGSRLEIISDGTLYHVAGIVDDAVTVGA